MAYVDTLFGHQSEVGASPNDDAMWVSSIDLAKSAHCCGTPRCLHIALASKLTMAYCRSQLKLGALPLLLLPRQKCFTFRVLATNLLDTHDV